MNTRRRVRDWDAVERDYRTGKFTLRELATKHGGTHQAIAKRAKDKGWVKDLTEEIRRATNAKLVAKLVDAEVAKSGQAVANTIAVAAEVNTGIILGHRNRVRRAVDLVMAMLAELEAATTRPEQLEALLTKVTEDPDPVNATILRQRFNDFMRVHNRVGSVLKLMDALNKAQTMERQAFNLDKDAGAGSADSFESRVADLEGQLDP